MCKIGAKSRYVKLKGKESYLNSGLSPFARGISLRKCCATRSVIPLLMKYWQVASKAPSSRDEQYPKICSNACIGM